MQWCLIFAGLELVISTGPIHSVVPVKEAHLLLELGFQELAGAWSIFPSSRWTPVCGQHLPSPEMKADTFGGECFYSSLVDL